MAGAAEVAAAVDVAGAAGAAGAELAMAGAMTWIGLSLATLAVAWSAWAAWTLARAGNPLRPGAAPRRFVDGGPFA